MQGIKQVRPVDPLLTDFAISWRQSRRGFVADALFPRVPVKGDTGTYYVWEAANVAVIRNSQWAKGSEANEVVLRATSATFSCKKYGLATVIDDDDRENVAVPFSLDTEAMESITELVLLDRERRAYAAAITALTADLDITTPANRQWDETASTCFADIEGGKEQIHKRTMKMPNLMIMGRPIFNSLRTNSGSGTAGLAVQERLKYSNPSFPGNINESLLAQAFDIERVIVADVVYDAAAQTDTIVGTGNVTGTYMWGDSIILAYVEPTPTTRSVSFAKTFTSFDLAALPAYRKDGIEGDVLRNRFKVDEKITMRNCAYVIKDVLAT